ncbi:MAG: hypothetical protein HY077_18050 [Elusimicrobia bacterium]|nr:hypothetical protein [Elusimicrobiota bacterium]
MDRIIGRLIVTVLGLAVFLGWTSLKSWWTGGAGGGAGAAVNKIPAKVWDGGGHKVVYRVTGTGKMRVSAWFSGRDAAGGQEKRSLETWEKADAGIHEFTIDAPLNSGATFDATAEEPKTGDSIAITVTADGKELCHDGQTLNEPLKSGYAFGVQCEIDDFAGPQGGAAGVE